MPLQPLTAFPILPLLPCPIDGLILIGRAFLHESDLEALTRDGWVVTRTQHRLDDGRIFRYARARNKATGMRIRWGRHGRIYLHCSLPHVLRGANHRLAGIAEWDFPDLFRRFAQVAPLAAEDVLSSGGWIVRRIEVCRDAVANFEQLWPIYRLARIPFMPRRDGRCPRLKDPGYLRLGAYSGSHVVLYRKARELFERNGELGDCQSDLVRLEARVICPGKRAWFRDLLTPASGAQPGEPIIAFETGPGQPPFRAVLRWADLHRALTWVASAMDGMSKVPRLNNERRLRIEQVITGKLWKRQDWATSETRRRDEAVALQKARKRVGISLVTLFAVDQAQTQATAVTS